jgi:large subunit ribosomal protein L23
MGFLGKIFGKTKDEPVKKAAAVSAKAKIAPSKAVKEKKVESAEEKKITAPANKIAKRDDAEILDWISKPLISEKATDLMVENKYCFVVPVSANKTEVMKKVANLYGVKPLSVNFVKGRGKRVRYGRRFGWKKDFKKAIVTIAPGEKIEMYEGV